MASIERTAYPRFKRTISSRELHDTFTVTSAEVGWAVERTATEQHRLALLVLLKCYQRLGYFPSLATVPADVVGYVRGQLELGESVAAEHDAPRTAKWHRGLVRDWLGVVYEPAKVREIAEAALQEAAQGKDNPADLINAALEQLVKARCELPGYTTLDQMAGAVRAEVNGALFAMVVARLDEPVRGRLLDLLVVDPVSRRSDFDRIKQPPGRATISKLRKWLEHLGWLDSLGPTGGWLEGVSPAKVSHFAGEAEVLDAAEMRDVGADKRLVLLVCLVHTARISARDDAVEMFCKRIAALHKKARGQLEELRERSRVDSERLLGVFGDVLAVVRDALGASADEQAVGVVDPIGEVSERAGRLVIKTLAEAGGVTALSGAHEAVSAHHGNNYAPLVERFYRSHRPALFALLDAVELEATSTDRTVADADAVVFLKAHRHARGEFIPDHDGGVVVDVSFAGEMWQKVLRDRHHPGRLARRHFEVCVFTYLAAELRSGDLAVARSNSYANLHAQLMLWAVCEPLVAGYCAQAGIPDTAAGFVAWMRAELTRTATAVDAGYPANADLVIDPDSGAPMLKARRGRERRASARVLEEEIHARLPQRSLLDILTRTAHLLGWHRHFGPASGSDPKLADPLA
ncbi:DUF4158 domain-containing protein [Candidatus Frankia alpina]|uniref:DUF4158 domain-containing protein n=1 Tax=Candidatus Frankia alpina TaxID=2699483 RepID=UPI0019677E95|nr:DUF4158 domain-containing protein [Candidatus Frankia alpina]